MRTKVGFKEFVFSPSLFFREKAQLDEYGLWAVLAIILTFLADFATKAVLFYKIGVANVRSPDEWAEFGGGYFGEVIGHQIGLGLKYAFLLGAFYLIGRFMGGERSPARLVNLSGYCFLPWLAGCSVLTLVYAFGLEIGFVDFGGDLRGQLTSLLIDSPAYVGQKVVGFNAWLWTAVLGAAMLGAYWKTRFSKSAAIMAAAVLAVTGLDRLGGMALQYVGWMR
ncbi:MAG: YIP1 family protein [Acidobacteriota bacterium]|jgi:hypothetical protein|nr:YIP1 family protein [Acidobacteriota bacterium]